MAAIDVDLPPWWLDEDTDVTWQVWNFYTSDTDFVEPDSVGFDSLLGTHITISPQTEWLQDYNPFVYYGIAGGEGIWNLSGGSINAFVENYDQPGTEKIWIQITWQPQQQDNHPVIYVDDPLGGTGPVTDPVIETLLENNWIHSTYEITLNYNPPFETIRIEGFIYVDDLVIDTLSIPEPAMICLLAAGWMIFRKRK